MNERNPKVDIHAKLPSHVYGIQKSKFDASILFKERKFNVKLCDTYQYNRTLRDLFLMHLSLYTYQSSSLQNPLELHAQQTLKPQEDVELSNIVKYRRTEGGQFGIGIRNIYKFKTYEHHFVNLLAYYFTKGESISIQYAQKWPIKKKRLDSLVLSWYKDYGNLEIGFKAKHHLYDHKNKVKFVFSQPLKKFTSFKVQVNERVETQIVLKHGFSKRCQLTFSYKWDPSVLSDITTKKYQSPFGVKLSYSV